MPLFMDRHDGLAEVTADDVAAAHVQDLEIQDGYGVRFLTYWFDPNTGSVVCLAEAPDADAAETAHRESHGLIPAKVMEGDRRMVESFPGALYEPEAGEPWAATAFRVILFTDIEGSTRLTQELGDAMAMRLLRDHDEVVRSSLGRCAGNEVRNTGDGILASFTSVAAALECATEIQRRLAERNQDVQPPLRVRIGVSAGELVTENGVRYGAAVQLVARLCEQAEPGSELVSGSVRELALGKGFRFDGHDPVLLYGSEEPIRPFALAWQN